MHSFGLWFLHSETKCPQCPLSHNLLASTSTILASFHRALQGFLLIPVPGQLKSLPFFSPAATESFYNLPLSSLKAPKSVRVLRVLLKTVNFNVISMGFDELRSKTHDLRFLSHPFIE